jgi:hypothetical protein
MEQVYTAIPVTRCKPKYPIPVDYKLIFRYYLRLRTVIRAIFDFVEDSCSFFVNMLYTIVD